MSEHRAAYNREHNTVEWVLPVYRLSRVCTIVQLYLSLDIKQPVWNEALVREAKLHHSCYYGDSPKQYSVGRPHLYNVARAG